MKSGNGKQSCQGDVLVVEDDPEINRLIGDYVEFAGYHYLPALDGSEAFAQVRDHHPSMIILDLMLPDLSGWEICRRLKSSRDTFDVPVIILTALDSEESRREGFLCGASEYMTKPFNPDEFLGVLQKYARAVQTAPST